MKRTRKDPSNKTLLLTQEKLVQLGHLLTLNATERNKTDIHYLWERVLTYHELDFTSRSPTYGWFIFLYLLPLPKPVLFYANTQKNFRGRTPFRIHKITCSMLQKIVNMITVMIFWNRFLRQKRAENESRPYILEISWLQNIAHF